uniref:Uncharacterized protein n=1 Tax=Anguilla anguilla TaxID=7936 RepID=A0A0E9X7R6_ANGAN
MGMEVPATRKNGIWKKFTFLFWFKKNKNCKLWSFPLIELH